jgi:hypothetical protein
MEEHKEQDKRKIISIFNPLSDQGKRAHTFSHLGLAVVVGCGIEAC